MYPQWFWILIPALPLLVWFHLRTLSDFPVAQRWISLAVRALVLILLVAALCGPILLRPTDRQMIVFAIDQSESIDPAARRKADAFIAEAMGYISDRDVDVRFLPFDRNPHEILLEWPVPDRTGEPDRRNSNDQAEHQTTARGTNLDAAIRTAVAAMPPSRVPRIVLLSDGNPTDGGDPLATAADAGVPVWTVPLPVRSEPEVQLTRVQAPAQVRQGEPFYVEIVVSCNHDTRGYVDLYRGDIQLGNDSPEPVDIKKGENRFRFRQSVTGRRQETFAARLRGFDDTLLDNNESSTVVYAQGRPRVLVIDSDPDETDSLRWALDEQLIDAEVRPPEGLPRDLAELQGYECLILSNVPATKMSLRQMDLIRIYVQDLGGGFIMLGGDQSFGLGGYYRTQVEEILPVRSNFEKEREKPSLAMMLVIDKSGSMGGQKIELAKDAARAAVELLGPRDAIGVIAFDGASYTVSELRPHRRRSWSNLGCHQHHRSFRRDQYVSRNGRCL